MLGLSDGIYTGDDTMSYRSGRKAKDRSASRKDKKSSPEVKEAARMAKQTRRQKRQQRRRQLDALWQAAVAELDQRLGVLCAPLVTTPPSVGPTFWQPRFIEAAPDMNRIAAHLEKCSKGATLNSRLSKDGVRIFYHQEIYEIPGVARRTGGK